MKAEIIKVLNEIVSQNEEAILLAKLVGGDREALGIEIANEAILKKIEELQK